MLNQDPLYHLSHIAESLKKINATLQEGQEQSDWEEADVSSPAYIKNKPTIPSPPVLGIEIAVEEGESDVYLGSFAGDTDDLINLFRAGVNVTFSESAVEEGTEPHYERAISMCLGEDEGTVLAKSPRWESIVITCTPEAEEESGSDTTEVIEDPSTPGAGNNNEGGNDEVQSPAESDSNGGAE